MSEQNRSITTLENVTEQQQIRMDKLFAMQDAGRDPFMVNTSDRDTYAKDISDNFEEFEGKTVCVAGRIKSKRGKGKVMFMDLWDVSGKIQIFSKFDDLGEEAYAGLKKWDIGDIVEIKGFVFRTQMGEVSIHSTEVRLLAKSLLPLPEKFHGLVLTHHPLMQGFVHFPPPPPTFPPPLSTFPYPLSIFPHLPPTSP